MPEGKEDIAERTFKFAAEIVRFCLNTQQSYTQRTLTGQLLRSGTSIGANVEEAQAGQSKKDFISKLAIARKEARETNYWLRLILETNLAEPEKVKPLIAEATRITKILTAIIKSTERSLEPRNQ